MLYCLLVLNNSETQTSWQ